MKTLFKILRSIITSLLFIIMSFALSIQFIFLLMKMENKDIPSLIDKKEILYMLLDEDKINNVKLENLLIEYIDDQLNYIFFSRSYPSSQNIDYTNLNDEQKKSFLSSIEVLKNKLDIDYNIISKLRTINSTLSNGAIFLIVNITVLVLFLATAIIKKSFKISLKILSIALSTSGLIISLIGNYIFSKLDNNLNTDISILISSIIDNRFINNYNNLTLIFIFVGVLLIFLIKYVDKVLKKEYKLKNKI